MLPSFSKFCFESTVPDYGHGDLINSDILAFIRILQVVKFTYETCLDRRFTDHPHTIYCETPVTILHPYVYPPEGNFNSTVWRNVDRSRPNIEHVNQNNVDAAYYTIGFKNWVNDRKDHTWCSWRNPFCGREISTGYYDHVKQLCADFFGDRLIRTATVITAISLTPADSVTDSSQFLDRIEKRGPGVETSDYVNPFTQEGT